MEEQSMVIGIVSGSGFVQAEATIGPPEHVLDMIADRLACDMDTEGAHISIRRAAPPCGMIVRFGFATIYGATPFPFTPKSEEHSGCELLRC